MMPEKEPTPKHSNKRTTYADTGVDVSAIRVSQNRIAESLSSTFNARAKSIGTVLTPIGHYAGVVRINDELALATHSDGVGTKVLVAQRAEQYDTVGIDCIAMNVNDLICLGAEPTTFLDYIALERHQPIMLEEIIKGLVQGAKLANVAITGGETAIMGSVIQGDRPGYGFDLAGFIAGFVNPKKIIDGKLIQKGDQLIGIESSGFHSNGYTLLRQLIFQKEGLHTDDPFPNMSKSVKEVLLTPTHIYTAPILDLIHSQISVHGIAHITGGAFGKLVRLTGSKLGFRITDLPEIPDMFMSIKALANLQWMELFRTFNCGIGMVLVVSPKDIDTTIIKIRSHGFTSWKIGEVVEKQGVNINYNGHEILV